MKTFVNLLKDRSGVSAAEYALLLAIIGSALALASLRLGGTISNSMGNVGDHINNCGGASC